MYVKTFTFQEFCELQEKKQINALDRSISQIRKNDDLYNQLIIIVAVLLLETNNCYAVGIDSLGSKILSKIHTISYWIIAIKGSVDIIQSMLNGDFHAGKRTFIQYLLIYGTLFALPWGLREVRDAFKSL